MGLSSSKHNAPGPSPPSSSSSSGAAVRRTRSSRSTALKSSCLRSHRSASNGTPQVSNYPSGENRNNMSCPCEHKCYKSDERDEMNSITSDTELEEWGESSFTNTISREVNTSRRAFSSREINPSNRFLSRFRFHPGSVSFHLTRSNSLRCDRAYPNDEEEEHPSSSTSSVNRNDRTTQGCDFLPSCFASRSPRTLGENYPDFCDNLQQFDSDRNLVRNRNETRLDCTPDLFSPVNHSGGIRHSDRRFATREPVEQNVQFSRTLSVGRLRDRVLRRTPVPDLGLYDLRRHREMRHSEGQGFDSLEATSDNNGSGQTTSTNNVPSSISIPFHGSENHVHETPRARETRYRDLLEHRSNFLERRRRIRSQVRALQRLGSRFENLSGHERSCILSGQHRAGHCTCRNAAREVNSSDDATARASISRIVMLAEALFEVLDEIHQQSVVLSSRPSVSSIGSVPAPNEVVDSLPLKIFSNKLKRKPCEEIPQCYICLVEYEEGDRMRVLPCHHEFHMACVDKWLKEIHRVCPLCRGDICQPDSLIALS